MAKYTEKQIIEACELRETGLSYRQISARTGMHHASVLEYCQSRGAVWPKAYRPKGATTFNSELDARITALSMQGLTSSKIHKIVGRPDKSVRNRLRALAFNEARLEATA